MLLTLKIFLENFNRTLLSILRVVFLSKFFVKTLNLKENNEIVILGNGPSFKKDIINHRSFLDGKDLICVNHFPISDYYTQLKPRYFITSAPDLWLDNIDEKFIIASKKLFDTMALKTTWPITVFIPFEARKHPRWKNQLAANKNISIQYYNNIAIEGFSFFKNPLFKLNLGMPRPHNIMIPSIITSMSLGYQSIYLWGADHSWLSEISVTDENEVLIHQKHFYDEGTSKAAPLDKRGKGQRKLHEILHKFMTAFEGYFAINEYAKSQNIKIINTTEGSFIDAFERLSLKKHLE